MCGISGIYDIRGIKSHDIEATLSMLSYMTHRGPDDSGLERFESCVIGQKRLSIIDLTQNAKQPFFDIENKVALVVNGEIYNYLELKEELLSAGFIFNSSSDSEVILHGYILWGESVFEKLRGMFSIAIYDGQKDKIILARDRIGIKPLYYQISDQNRLMFSSEIGSLMQSKMTSKKINYNALHAYLFLGYSPQRSLLVDGIKSIEPGTFLSICSNGVKKSKFWDMPKVDHELTFNDEDLIIRVREILERSIQLHIQSDVPLGVFLSGGIDSTLIAGLLSQNHSNVKTLSVGFDDGDSKLNEIGLAKKTADFYGADHSEFILNGKAVRDRMASIVRHIDSPTFDSINTFIVSEMAKKAGLTVALSGLGGDELFGGYPIYNSFSQYSKLINAWSLLPQTIKKVFITTMKSLSDNSDRRNKLSRLADVSSIDHFYSMARANSWISDIDSLMSFDNKSENIYSEDDLFNLFSEENIDLNYWKYLQHNELRNYVGWRLLRDTDAMSMAHSIEVRVPLLDDELLNFMLALKPGWEKSLGWPKKLLVEATRDILPEHILNKNKQGFQLPMEVWMKNELKVFLDETFSNSVIQNRGLFDTKSMTKLMTGFKNNQVNYTEIWKFVILELWMQEHGITS